MNVKTALRAEVTSVAAARRFVRMALQSAGVDEAVVDAAEIVAGEIAAHAALHGHGDGMRLHVTTGGERLRIELDDPSDVLPEPEGEPWSAAGLIGVLTVAWGIERTPAGSRVWCELDPAAPAATAGDGPS